MRKRLRPPSRKNTRTSIPDLKAAPIIEVRGAGERFDGTYRVKSKTYNIGEGEYATRFTVRLSAVLQKHADDKHYDIDTQNDGSTTVLFGNGVIGARLPRGRKNVATYLQLSVGIIEPKTADAEEVDRSIALLDVLAALTDVLSDYQDRVAAEACLQTGRRRKRTPAYVALLDKNGKAVWKIPYPLRFHASQREGGAKGLQ